MFLLIFFIIFGVAFCCILMIFCVACARGSEATHTNTAYSTQERAPSFSWSRFAPPVRQTQPVRQTPVAKQNKVKIQPESQPLIYKGKEEKECSICLENIHFGDLIKCCNCSHCFHKDCIERWLQDNKTCPLCRRPCRF